MDPDVPLLQRMRKTLAQEVKRKKMTQREASLFLGQYADALVRTPHSRKIRILLEEQ